MATATSEGDRVIIRRKGDKAFENGFVDLFATKEGKLAVIHNEGFEILLVKTVMK